MKTKFKNYLMLIIIINAVCISQSKSQCGISQPSLFQVYTVNECNGMVFQSAIGAKLSPYDDCGGLEYTSPLTASSIISRTGNNYQQYSVRIFPNPVAHSLYVELNDLTGDMDYRLQDILGHVIKSGKIQNLKTTLDVTDLTDGYYLLVLQKSLDLIITKPFIKN